VRAEPTEHFDPGAVRVTSEVQGPPSPVGIVVATFPALVASGTKRRRSGRRPTRTSAPRRGAERPAGSLDDEAPGRSEHCGAFGGIGGVTEHPSGGAVVEHGVPALHPCRTGEASNVSVSARVTWAAARSHCSRSLETTSRSPSAHCRVARVSVTPAMNATSRGVTVSRRKATSARIRVVAAHRCLLEVCLPFPKHSHDGIFRHRQAAILNASLADWKFRRAWQQNGNEPFGIGGDARAPGGITPLCFCRSEA
jgi:hypothetical protein